MKTLLFIIATICLVQTSILSFALPVASEKRGALPPLIPSRVEFSGAPLPIGSSGEGNNTLVTRNSKSIYYASASEIKELEFTTILSANAYCRSVIPDGKWDCKHCGGVVKNLVLVQTWTTSKLDTNAMVLRSDKDKKIYVVFRGSNSLVNFATDLIFITKDYPPVNGTKVHTGFYDGYVEVQKSLVAGVLSQLDKYPKYKITVTGHSLGGAYALLHALDLFQRDPRITTSNLQIITQGEPRTGNPAFANYAASTGIRHRRVIHQKDPVPHLPAKSFGFLHAGVEEWITTSEDVVKVCNSKIETEDCSNSVIALDIFDHLSYFDYNMGLCL